MEGWCTKRGGGTSLFGRKSWKRRYFYLDDDALTYYTSEVGGEQKGKLRRRDIIEVLTVHERSERRALKKARTALPPNVLYNDVAKRSPAMFCLRTKHRTIFLFCDTKAERDQWLQALSR